MGLMGKTLTFKCFFSKNTFTGKTCFGMETSGTSFTALYQMLYLPPLIKQSTGTCQPLSSADLCDHMNLMMEIVSESAFAFCLTGTALVLG